MKGEIGMKQWILLLCIFCLLLGGCKNTVQPATPSAGQEQTEQAPAPLPDIEKRLQEFYPEGEIRKITEGEDTFWEVICETDLKNYDRIQYGGTAEGYKYVSSLEALRKIDSKHYCIVKGYRVGTPRQRVRFTESGAVNMRGTSFTVRVTGVYHKTDEEIADEIVISGSGYMLLPHGKERVLHKGQLELPKENEEYFFVLNKTADMNGNPVYHYYNPLISDLRIDEGLKNEKNLTPAQKLTWEMMEEFL